MTATSGADRRCRACGAPDHPSGCAADLPRILGSASGADQPTPATWDHRPLGGGLCVCGQPIHTRVAPSTGQDTGQPWRVGQHYGIHVYEGDRPVATFHRAEDAAAAVEARAQVQRAAEVVDTWDDGEPWKSTLRRALGQP